jgi:hypothetical protein
MTSSKSSTTATIFFLGHDYSGTEKETVAPFALPVPSPESCQRPFRNYIGSDKTPEQTLIEFLFLLKPLLTELPYVARSFTSLTVNNSNVSYLKQCHKSERMTGRQHCFLFG